MTRCFKASGKHSPRARGSLAVVLAFQITAMAIVLKNYEYGTGNILPAQLLGTALSNPQAYEVNEFEIETMGGSRIVWQISTSGEQHLDGFSWAEHFSQDDVSLDGCQMIDGVCELGNQIISKNTFIPTRARITAPIVISGGSKLGILGGITEKEGLELISGEGQLIVR